MFSADEVLAALPFLSREASLELENILLKRKLVAEQSETDTPVEEDDLPDEE